MNKLMMTGILVSALAIGSSALAAPAGELVQPRPPETGYTTVVKDLTSNLATAQNWIASSDIKGYYLALRDVRAAYPNSELDLYQLTVREAPTSYYVRDVLIPQREAAGLSVDGYENYAYSLSSYQIRIERKAGVERELLSPPWAWENNAYYVAKVSQKDYTADGKLLGESQPNEDLTLAEKGSDYYTLAVGVDKRMYRFRPAGR